MEEMDAQAGKLDLFPRIEPYGHGLLAVGDGHSLYWEQLGNPEGVPVVFLHGGPGAGASTTHRRFFDPETYRIIIFDQRGAGRSKPFAGLAGNTTQHLIADIERLREHLGVDRWLVFGGSWGVTLALAYGIRHPERCLGFILRGIFLARARELHWFLYEMYKVFPEAWRAFTEFLPASERGDLLDAYYVRLCSPDPAVHGPAAAAWCAYESACSNLLTEPAPPAAGAGQRLLALARIEAHYFKNALYLEDGYLLENVDKLRQIPATIVQGRYDMVCPVVTADELARAWPEAEYVIVPDAGHSALEPGIRSALVAATEAFKARILPEHCNLDCSH